MGAVSKDVPRTAQYEFSGSIGAIGIMFGLPFVIFLLYIVCNKAYCFPNLPPLAELYIPSLSELLSLDAFLVYVAWFGFVLALFYILPGPIVEGVPLRDNKTRLKYKLNAFPTFIVCIAAIGLGAYSGVLPITYIYDNFLQLAFAVVIFVYILSIYLYIKSRIEDKGIAPLGNTGNVLYDFFIGHQLNPRIGSLDLKFFCELRPGLIGWVVINFAMAVKQYQNFGYVSNSMILVNLFQFIYVADALWFERAILTTMDIITDGFGFMLAFGDLAWVPFTYSTQARFLADHPVDLSPLAVVVIVLIKILGMSIFRLANLQKDTFRRNPNDPRVKHLRYIETKRGTKLLVSGWWGIARHFNYCGDWLTALSWCLPTGFSTPVTYFYFIYFVVLLIHREHRDEHNCRLKYGDDWDRYCKIVKWRIIPYIY